MAYVLTLQPTFTQGFILGQLSILVLLVLVLKYLFLDSSTETAASPPLAPLSSSIRSGIKRENYGEKPISDQDESLDTPPAPMSNDKESTEWFNLILHEVGSLLYETVCALKSERRYLTRTAASCAIMSRDSGETRSCERE